VNLDRFNSGFKSRAWNSELCRRSRRSGNPSSARGQRDISYSGPQFTLTILSIFAVIGLILVAIGAYSVLAYTVSQQTHEIGIRIALGAAEQSVFLMVLRIGAVLVSIGLAVGLVASLLLNRLIANQLWGVQPHDQLTMISVILIIAIIGTVACLVPARRNPVVYLRYE
jgi:putative ABC transport system permease protein